MQNKKLKRILLDTDEEFYMEIKMRALTNRMSLKKYVIRALIEQILRDKNNE